jgi:hypothetical protein
MDRMTGKYGSTVEEIDLNQASHLVSERVSQSFPVSF